MTVRNRIAEDDGSAMIQFALRWAPYGGGLEDILVTFGMSARTFYSRLRVMLINDPRLVDPLELLELLALCDRIARESVERPARSKYL